MRVPDGQVNFAAEGIGNGIRRRVCRFSSANDFLGNLGGD
jgi:hypothetical protein